MAVAGPNCYTRASVTQMQNASSDGSNNSVNSSNDNSNGNSNYQPQAIVSHSCTPSSYYRTDTHCVNRKSRQRDQEFQPDRPIGYGAFGVVWYVLDLKLVLTIVCIITVNLILIV